MKTLMILTLVITMLALVPCAFAGTLGEEAPNFSASSTMGTISLSQYKGVKNVVLAFYIEDFTPG
jgi:hypothetical protein